MPSYDTNTLIKSKLFQLLCSDAEVVSLLTNVTSPSVPNKNLMYKQIWPYKRVTDCCKDAKPQICFDIVISRIDSWTICERMLEIVFLVPDSMMRTDTGTVADRLENRVLKLFQGSRDFGIGRLLLKTSRPNESGDIPDGWQWRRLIFEVKDFNIKSDDPLWA